MNQHGLRGNTNDLGDLLGGKSRPDHFTNPEFSRGQQMPFSDDVESERRKDIVEVKIQRFHQELYGLRKILGFQLFHNRLDGKVQILRQLFFRFLLLFLNALYDYPQGLVGFLQPLRNS